MSTTPPASRGGPVHGLVGVTPGPRTGSVADCAPASVVPGAAGDLDLHDDGRPRTPTAARTPGTEESR